VLDANSYQSKEHFLFMSKQNNIALNLQLDITLCNQLCLCMEHS